MNNQQIIIDGAPYNIPQTSADLILALQAKNGRLRERLAALEAGLSSIRQHERELYADGGRVAYTNPDLKWQEMYLELFDMMATEATE